MLHKRRQAQRFRAAVFLASLFLMLSACGGDERRSDSDAPTPTVTGTPVPTDSPSVAATPLIPDAPRENGEAEAAALCASGELVAPEALYETFKNDFAAIRAEFAGSIPAVNEIGFAPPWVVGQLILGVTELGAEAIRNGEAHGLDSLNSIYHLAHMDMTNLDSFSPRVLLTFKGRLHPLRLTEIYRSSLDILRYAQPNWFVGDSSKAYPRVSAEERRYLFRQAWGDCPAGCIYSRFWYFRVTDAGIEYVGTWDRTDPEPPWWPEARVAMEQYCMLGGPHSSTVPRLN